MNALSPSPGCGGEPHPRHFQSDFLFDNVPGLNLVPGKAVRGPEVLILGLQAQRAGVRPEGRFGVEAWMSIRPMREIGAEALSGRSRQAPFLTVERGFSCRGNGLSISP